MSPQEQTYLSRVNRNVKRSPWITAVITSLSTVASVAFMLGKKEAELNAHLQTQDAAIYENKVQISELKTQANNNTANIRSLIDWRAEKKR